MKVCHITTAHSVFDERIYHKECITLKEAGYDVYLVGVYEKDIEANGIHIKALTSTKGRFKRIFFSTFVALKKALQTGAALYHFHDPELIPAGIVLKLLGKKVIYDIHEDVPKQIYAKDWLGNERNRNVISGLMSLLEKIVSRIYDGIISVSPEIADKYPEEKTALIRNFVILNIADKAKKIDLSNKNRIVCIYAGGLAKKRGIKDIIQAMHYLNGRFELLLLGPWENENFKKECAQLNGWPYVNDLGCVRYQDVFNYVKSSDIGLVPYHPTGIMAIPNKPFEYMACSLPLVMSNRSNWRTLFDKCALFVDPQNPIDIAEKIQMLEDDSMRKSLGNAGRYLVENEYSWEREGQELIKFYQKFSDTARKNVNNRGKRIIG